MSARVALQEVRERLHCDQTSVVRVVASTEAKRDLGAHRTAEGPNPLTARTAGAARYQMIGIVRCDGYAAAVRAVYRHIGTFCWLASDRVGKLAAAIRTELKILGEFFRWLRPGDRGLLWGMVGAAVMSLYSASFTAEGQAALPRLGYAAAGAIGGGILGLRMEQHFDDGPWSKRLIAVSAVLLLALAGISIVDALVT